MLVSSFISSTSSRLSECSPCISTHVSTLSRPGVFHICNWTAGENVVSLANPYLYWDLLMPFHHQDLVFHSFSVVLLSPQQHSHASPSVSCTLFPECFSNSKTSDGIKNLYTRGNSKVFFLLFFSVTEQINCLRVERPL